MSFQGFSKKGIKFLKDLSKNNTKVWFEDHRHIWEDEIQKQTKDYVQEMGETLQILVPSINFNPKVSGSLFKIYRDVRFSKDKTPMKSKIGIIFWQGTSHRMQSSSFYMHFDKDEYFIATGIRNFKQPLLKTFREYLKDNKKREELHHIIEDLQTKGYLFPEAKFKRLPRGIAKEDSFLYLYFFGAMYAYQIFKIDKIFYSEEILNRVFKIYEDMLHLQQWVYEMTLTHIEEE
jgi:uncharacterized protein (TIGR02453 family)